MKFWLRKNRHRTDLVVETEKPHLVGVGLFRSSCQWTGVVLMSILLIVTVSTLQSDIAFAEKEQSNQSNGPDRLQQAKDISRTGISYLRENKPAEAETAFREAIRLDPTNNKYHSYLGDVLLSQGKTQEAETAYAEAKRLSGLSKKQENTSIDEVPHDEMKKEAEDTSTEFQPIDEMTEIQQDTSESMYLQGEKALDAGRYEEAEAAFRTAIQQNPNQAKNYVALGEALFAQGKLEAAEGQYRKAVELEPDNAKHHFHVGDVLSGQGKWADAANKFQDACSLAPDNGYFRLSLADALDFLGRSEEAERLAEEGMRLIEEHEVEELPAMDGDDASELTTHPTAIITGRPEDEGFMVYEWLGAIISSVSPDIAPAFGRPELRGALVLDVFSPSPCSDSGLQVDDVVVGISGSEVFDVPTFVEYTEKLVPGQSVTISIVRDANDVKLSLKVPSD